MRRNSAEARPVTPASTPAEPASDRPPDATHTHAASPSDEEVVYQKKPPKKRRVVVVQESSDSEEEIEVKLPKQKKKQPQITQADAMYQRTYQRMFEL